ncbi:MAG: hypothetical protein BGO01_17595 [Armatimonadetes bacterium 55-13]|nr:hypothetical protein [Armatimonadota bacterium]OJU63957.1 MAG: hypothetical protein BGO01_17595 [Armatimonadetes bacterium 55-13]
MTLNAYAAAKRLAIFDELQAGHEPSEGLFDHAILEEGRVKGHPQMGTTTYEPNCISLEFIYPDPSTSATVLSVKLTPPERIVFLPVPEWVVESIWQGEISGSFHFESDAQKLYEALGSEITAENNKKWFGPQMAKRRE